MPQLRAPNSEEKQKLLRNNINPETVLLDPSGDIHEIDPGNKVSPAGAIARTAIGSVVPFIGGRVGGGLVGMAAGAPTGPGALLTGAAASVGGGMATSALQEGALNWAGKHFSPIKRFQELREHDRQQYPYVNQIGAYLAGPVGGMGVLTNPLKASRAQLGTAVALGGGIDAVVQGAQALHRGDSLSSIDPKQVLTSALLQGAGAKHNEGFRNAERNFMSNRGVNPRFIDAIAPPNANIPRASTPERDISIAKENIVADNIDRQGWTQNIPGLLTLDDAALAKFGSGQATGIGQAIVELRNLLGRNNVNEGDVNSLILNWNKGAAQAIRITMETRLSGMIDDGHTERQRVRDADELVFDESVRKSEEEAAQKYAKLRDDQNVDINLDATADNTAGIQKFAASAARQAERERVNIARGNQRNDADTVTRKLNEQTVSAIDEQSPGKSFADGDRSSGVTQDDVNAAFLERPEEILAAKQAMTALEQHHKTLELLRKRVKLTPPSHPNLPEWQMQLREAEQTYLARFNETMPKVGKHLTVGETVEELPPSQVKRAKPDDTDPSTGSSETPPAGPTKPIAPKPVVSPKVPTQTKLLLESQTDAPVVNAVPAKVTSPEPVIPPPEPVAVQPVVAPAPVTAPKPVQQAPAVQPVVSSDRSVRSAELDVAIVKLNNAIRAVSAELRRPFESRDKNKIDQLMLAQNEARKELDVKQRAHNAIERTQTTAPVELPVTPVEPPAVQPVVQPVTTELRKQAELQRDSNSSAMAPKVEPVVPTAAPVVKAAEPVVPTTSTEVILPTAKAPEKINTRPIPGAVQPPPINDQPLMKPRPEPEVKPVAETPAAPTAPVDPEVAWHNAVERVFQMKVGEKFKLKGVSYIITGKAVDGTLAMQRDGKIGGNGSLTAEAMAKNIVNGYAEVVKHHEISTQSGQQMKTELDSRFMDKDVANLMADEISMNSFLGKTYKKWIQADPAFAKQELSEIEYFKSLTPEQQQTLIHDLDTIGTRVTDARISEGQMKRGDVRAKAAAKKKFKRKIDARISEGHDVYVPKAPTGEITSALPAQTEPVKTEAPVAEPTPGKAVDSSAIEPAKKGKLAAKKKDSLVDEGDIENNSTTSQQRKAYQEAVNNGDAALSERLENDAAKNDGFNVGPVYHGSKVANIGKFDQQRFQQNESHKRGEGFYFEGRREGAAEYTRGKSGEQQPKNVTKVYLSLHRPAPEILLESWYAKIHDAQMSQPNLQAGQSAVKRVAREMRMDLESKGYDGYYTIGNPAKGYIGEVVVFDPRKIKLAADIVRDLSDVKQKSSLNDPAVNQSGEHNFGIGSPKKIIDYITKAIAPTLERVRLSGTMEGARFAKRGEEVLNQIRALSYPNIDYALAAKKNLTENEHKKITAYLGDLKYNNSSTVVLDARLMEIAKRAQIAERMLYDQKTEANTPLVEDHTSTGVPIYRKAIARRNYMTEALDPATQKLKNEGTDLEGIQAAKDDIELWAMSRGTSKEDAVAYAENLMNKPPPLSMGDDSANLAFQALRKPQGLGLPPNRRANVFDAIIQEATKQAKDIANHRGFEKDPIMAKALRLKHNGLGERIPESVLNDHGKETSTGLSNNPDVKEFFESMLYAGEPGMQGFEAGDRLIKSMWVSTTSGLRDLAGTGHILLELVNPHESKFVAKALYNLITDYRGARDRAINAGSMSPERSINPNVSLAAADTANKIADAVQKLSGSTLMNETQRMLADQVGRIKAETMILNNDTAFLDKHGPIDWRTWKHEKLVNYLAQEAANTVVGSYDARGLPPSLLPGSTHKAKFMLSLARWSVERYARFKNNVIAPAMKGNIVPLVASMTAALLEKGGYDYIVEAITDAKPNELTWTEWLKLDNKDTMYTLFSKLNALGYGGIASQIALTVNQTATGEPTRAIDNVMLAAAKDSMVHVKTFLADVKDGRADLIEDFPALLATLLRSNMQVLRIVTPIKDTTGAREAHLARRTGYMNPQTGYHEGIVSSPFSTSKIYKNEDENRLRGYLNKKLHDPIPSLPAPPEAIRTQVNIDPNTGKRTLGYYQFIQAAQGNTKKGTSFRDDEVATSAFERDNKENERRVRLFGSALEKK
jgi:hypothetical protein